jgi:hypothetical protein
MDFFSEKLASHAPVRSDYNHVDEEQRYKRAQEAFTRNADVQALELARAVYRRFLTGAEREAFDAKMGLSPATGRPLDPQKSCDADRDQFSFAMAQDQFLRDDNMAALNAARDEYRGSMPEGAERKRFDERHGLNSVGEPRTHAVDRAEARYSPFK